MALAEIWIAFFVLVFALLALDLGVLNRKAHAIGVKEALGWTAFWVAMALAFNVAVYFLYQAHVGGLGTGLDGKGNRTETSGGEAAMLFFSGYLLEESLSMDNMFVIAMIFTYFQVPRQFQHRTLFWGIVGALVLRGVMIGLGTTLEHHFDWIMYVFGAVLIFTAIKMLRAGEEKIEPDRNPLVRLARRVYPVSSGFEGQKFFTRLDGRRAITPLFVVLLVIESTDVVFATDSIPAIFGVTTDSFLVMTSNVFAILGLRSLFFALSAIMDKFHYLKFSLVFVLVFIGVKMIVGCKAYPILELPTPVSLGVVAGLLAVGVAASLLRAAKAQPEGEDEPDEPVS
jgi:tellurite resistance protein TerC